MHKSVSVLFVSAWFSFVGFGAPASAQTAADFIAGKTKDCPGCNLAGANLKRRNLAGANLSGADLTDASFHRSNLRGANFSGANLTGNGDKERRMRRVSKPPSPVTQLLFAHGERAAFGERRDERGMRRLPAVFRTHRAALASAASLPRAGALEIRALTSNNWSRNRAAASKSSAVAASRICSSSIGISVSGSTSS